MPDIVVDWLKQPKLRAIAPRLVYMVISEEPGFGLAMSHYSMGADAIAPYTVTPPPAPTIVATESSSVAPRGV